MKDFEEWWILESQNIVGVGRATEKDIAEEGYRAALEMVHKYMIEQEPDAPYFDYVLLDKIEKELKG